MTLKSDVKFKEKLAFKPKLELKTYRGVMAMKNDTKFAEGFTCRFNINLRNLTNFDPST